MLAHQSAWRVDLNLADVGVAPVLVVGQYGHLDKVCTKHAAVCRLLARRQDGDPTARLVELLDMDLLQVVEGAARADRDLRGRVALVQLEVSIDDDLVDVHLLVKLDVDQVRLGTVRSGHAQDGASCACARARGAVGTHCQ